MPDAALIDAMTSLVGALQRTPVPAMVDQDAVVAIVQTEAGSLELEARCYRDQVEVRMRIGEGAILFADALFRSEQEVTDSPAAAARVALLQFKKRITEYRDGMRARPDPDPEHWRETAERAFSAVMGVLAD